MATRLPRHLREVRKFQPDLAKWKDASYLTALFIPLERILVAKLEKHHPLKATATGVRLTESQYLSLVKEFEILADEANDLLIDAAKHRSSKDRVRSMYDSIEEWWDRINRMVSQRSR